MPLEVDYVAWAIGAGANVYTPAVYQALATLSTGVEPGLADPQQANTTWRLASMTSAALANFISQQLGINVLDDGNLSALVANLTSAVAGASAIKPGRIVTSSAALNMVSTDCAIYMLRTAGLAALTINLPTTGVAVGQEFEVYDISASASGFEPYPASVTPPGGHDIAGLPGAFVMNQNRQANFFRYAGSNHWGVK